MEPGEKELEVGEIVLAKNFMAHPEYNGQECLVIGGLMQRDVVPSTKGYVGKLNPSDVLEKDKWTYRVEFEDGKRLGPFPSQLERKKPKAKEDENIRETSLGLCDGAD